MNKIISQTRTLLDNQGVLDTTVFEDGRVVEWFHHVHDLLKWIHTKDQCDKCWTWIKKSTGEEVKFCEDHGGKYPDYYDPMPQEIKDGTGGPFLIWIY